MAIEGGEDGVSADQLAAIDDEVAQLVNDAVEFAETSPEPGPEDLMTDVYINY